MDKPLYVPKYEHLATADGQSVETGPFRNRKPKLKVKSLVKDLHSGDEILGDINCITSR